MAINELKDFLYENYYKRVAFNKEKTYCPLNELDLIKKRLIIH